MSNTIGPRTWPEPVRPPRSRRDLDRELLPTLDRRDALAAQERRLSAFVKVTPVAMLGALGGSVALKLAGHGYLGLAVAGLGALTWAVDVAKRDRLEMVREDLRAVSYRADRLTAEHRRLQTERP